MFRPRYALPLDHRTEAHQLLTGELIAAITQLPMATVESGVAAWLDAAESVASARGSIVFDEFVIGRPEPALLEIAHHLRVVRRREEAGHFDHEEDDWYDLHGEDAELWEPPRLPERVAAGLTGRPGIGPIANGDDVYRAMARSLAVARDDVIDLILLTMAIERMVTWLAGATRIGDLVVVGVRPTGRRRDEWEWAA